MELTGDDPVHPQRYFGTPAVTAALQTLAARVQAPAAEIAALPPAQGPSGTFPDRVPREPEYDEFAFFVALVWEDQLSHSLLNERQARNHYHVRF